MSRGGRPETSAAVFPSRQALAAYLSSLGDNPEPDAVRGMLVKFGDDGEQVIEHYARRPNEVRDLRAASAMSRSIVEAMNAFQV